MLDLQAMEQEAQTPYNAQGSDPAPAIPKKSPSKPRRTEAVNIPSQNSTLTEAQLDAEYDAMLKEAGIDKGSLDTQPEQTIMEAATSRGFFKTLWDYGTAMPVNTLRGIAQFGTNLSNVSKEAAATVYNSFADKKITVERNTVYSPTDTPEARTWAKMGEIGTPTVLGATIGSFIGTPMIGGPIGGVIGGMIGSFIQDPDEQNISTALQNTKYSMTPIIGPVLNFYAHRPGDSDLTKRMKNMYENGLVDVLGGAAISAAATGAKAAARSRVVQAAKDVMKNVVEDVRMFGTKKVPTPVETPSVPAAQSMDTASVELMTEQELAAKEAAYVKQGEDTMHEFAGIVSRAEQAAQAEQLNLGDMGTQQKPVPPEGSTAGATQLDLGTQGQAPAQMDFFEMIGELEQLNKARKDAIFFDAHQKELAAGEFGERQLAKQRSLFKGRPVRMDDPRLKGEQLSLFDIDDVDTAGFSYDPKQASFFEKEWNNVLPEQLDIPEDKFIEIEQMRNDPTIPAEQVVAAEKAAVPAPQELRITPADDSIVERLDQLQENRAAYYEEKRARGEVADYQHLQEQAARRNQMPGEALRILNLPRGYVPNSMEMAQIQDLWVRSFIEKEILAEKVAAGIANDLELVAYKQALENHYNISMKYYTAGTESAHSLGIRRTIRNYAKAGDPLAIKLIGNEGKIKSVGALLQEWGGRANLQDEAKFYSQVMEVLNNKNANMKTIGDLNLLETRDVVKKVQTIYARPDAAYLMSRDGEIMVKSRGRQLVDGITGYMFDNMILSPVTLVNTWGAMPFDLGMRVGTNYTMSLLAGARGDIPEMAFRFDKANRYSMALIKNVKDALKAGAREFVGTQSPGDIVISSQGGVPEYLKQYARQGMQNVDPAITAEVDAVRRVLTPTYGWTIGLGRKALAASDAFIHHLGYNAHVEAELLERGYRSGLRGEALDTFVRENFKKPPTDIHDAALIEGAKFGYRADIDNLNIMGMTPMSAVESGLYQYPALKLFMPFFRSYGNTVQNTLEYLPGLTYALKTSRDNLEKSVAQQMVGAGALIGMASLYLDDHLTLPDFFSQSPYKKYAEVDEQGKPIANQPMALRHDDGSTTKLPWGGAMQKFGLLAGYIAMMTKYAPEEEVGAYIAGGTMALAQAMSVDDQFRAFNELVQAVSDVGRGTGKKGTLEYAASIAERFIPFNRIGKDINTALETSQNGFTVDISGVGDVKKLASTEALDYLISALDNRLRAIVPGSSTELPPEYNIIGEPVPAFGKGLWNIPGVMTTTEGKSSDVMSKLSALALHASLYPGDIYKGVQVDRLPKNLDIGGIPVKLSPNEYARFQAYYGGVDPQSGKVAHPSGLTLRDALSFTFTKNQKKWEGVSTKTITPQDFNSMVADVNEVFSTYRNWAKAQMAKEPSIIKKINDITAINTETRARGVQLINTVLGR